MVLLGKILALLGHNEREKLEFCPFFKSVRKILFSSVFLSCSLLLCFLLIKRDEKEEKMWSRRKNSVLFLDTSHEREKEEKIHSHYYEGRSAF